VVERFVKTKTFFQLKVIYCHWWSSIRTSFAVIFFK